MKRSRDVWLGNALLLGVVGVLGYLYASLPQQTALAAGGGWDTNGVMVATTNASERLVLVDTNKKVICVYRVAGAGRFRLVGARSYKYDVEIKDSTNTPVEAGQGVTFGEAKLLWERLEKQRVVKP